MAPSSCFRLLWPAPRRISSRINQLRLSSTTATPQATSNSSLFYTPPVTRPSPHLEYLNPPPLSTLHALSARLTSSLSSFSSSKTKVIPLPILERVLISPSFWSGVKNDFDTLPSRLRNNAHSSNQLTHFHDASRAHNLPFAVLGNYVLGYLTIEEIRARFPYLPTRLQANLLSVLNAPILLASISASMGIAPSKSYQILINSFEPEATLERPTRRPLKPKLTREQKQLEYFGGLSEQGDEDNPNEPLGHLSEEDLQHQQQRLGKEAYEEDPLKGFGGPRSGPGGAKFGAGASAGGAGLLRWKRGQFPEEMIPWLVGGAGASERNQAKSILFEDELTLTTKALLGAVWQIHGLDATRQWIRDNIFTRHVDLDQILKFEKPQKVLSDTLIKYGKDKPVARLLKETGRYSVSPVFLVGVYSSTLKLGEGFGSSLDMASYRAYEDALRRIYLAPHPGHPPSTAAGAGVFAPSGGYNTNSNGISRPSDVVVHPDWKYDAGVMGDSEVIAYSARRS